MRTAILIVLVSFAAFASNAVSQPPAASDVRFTTGRSALGIPFKLYNNHIYLRVTVNDSQPLWFVLDTGARNIFSLKHAQTLGLKFTPAGQGRGNGERTEEFFTTENVTFGLPGVTIARQWSAVFNMEGLEECSNLIDVDPQGGMTLRSVSRKGDERQAFEGILGYEFFKLFVVELDYAAQVMNLYDPKDHQYKGRGDTIPLDIRRPYISIHTQLASARGGPVKGQFMIDTGFMGALSLRTPFIEKNALMPADDVTRPFEICGIGGGSKARIGSVGSLRLGSADVKSPVTIFSQARSGQMADNDYDALIGNAILRHYKVVFDYSRSRMILEPQSGNFESKSTKED